MRDTSQKVGAFLIEPLQIVTHLIECHRDRFHLIRSHLGHRRRILPLTNLPRGFGQRVQRPVDAAHQKQCARQRQQSSKHSPADPRHREILFDDAVLRKQNPVVRVAHWQFGDERGSRAGFRCVCLWIQIARAWRALEYKNIGFGTKQFTQALAGRTYRRNVGRGFQRIIEESLCRHQTNAAFFAELRHEVAVLRGRNRLQRRADGFQVAHIAGRDILIARLLRVIAKQQYRHHLAGDQGENDHQCGARE